MSCLIWMLVVSGCTADRWSGDPVAEQGGYEKREQRSTGILDVNQQEDVLSRQFVVSNRRDGTDSEVYINAPGRDDELTWTEDNPDDNAVDRQVALETNINSIIAPGRDDELPLTVPIGQ